MSLFCERSPLTDYRDQTAASVLAGAPQSAADIDPALLKTLRHLRGLPSSVLLNLIQLMSEPIAFWHEASQSQAWLFRVQGTSSAANLLAG